MLTSFSQPLFWYKLIFLGELLVAEGLVCYKLRRREHFWWRLFSSVLLLACLVFFFPLPVFNAFYSSFMFLVIFALTILAMVFLFDEPWLSLLFAGLIAYTIQHLAYETFNLLITVFSLGSTSGFYSSEGAGFEINYLEVIVYFVAYGLIYWLLWALVSPKIEKNGEMRLDNMSLFYMSTLILLIDIILNAFLTYDTSSVSLTYQIITILYNMICCIFAIGMQFALLDSRQSHEELRMMDQLWEEDKKHYESAQENIEVINIKFHDLKHQIRALKAGGSMEQGALDEMENAVNTYDTTVKSGNKALDVVLTEKSLLCEKRKIKLSTIVDASQLAGMAPSDIYSFFGNALDNAIEYVSKFPEEEKRFIRFSLRSSGSLSLIHVENYFEGDLKVSDNGLPQTTKENADYHGFGVKSMKAIAEKYNGNVSFKAGDGLFSLDAVLAATGEAGNGKTA